MALVVQKYGGSSVADAEGIKRVAKRIVATEQAGNQVVVVVSAMGDIHRRADRPGQPGQPGAARPRARHAAHRRGAHLDGAARDGDRHPGHGGALVHRVAGGRHHRRRCTAGRGSSTSRPAGSPARSRRARSRSWPDSRASRRPPRTSPRSAAAARTPRPWRSRPRCSADVCEIYTDVDGVFTEDPRLVPGARRIPRITYEEMLEMAACGAKVLMPRCVEYARRYELPIHVRSSFSDKTGTWVSGHAGGRVGGSRNGAGHYLRGRARPERGARSPWSACPTGWARPRGSSGSSPRPASTST